MPSRSSETPDGQMPTKGTPETSRHDADLKADLQDDSDNLLASLEEIRRLETHKRQLRMSSPEFQTAANEVERKARAVFSLARAQREVGEELSAHDDSIDDQPARERAPR